MGAALLPALVLAALGPLLDVRALAYAAGDRAGPAAARGAPRPRRVPGLGHGTAGDYLVARSGAVRRSTVALRRGGVIGWTVRQSYVQRRAGLLTLTATTAAGDGAYHVRDADASEGLRFAATAVPGLLEPFLEPAE